MAHRQAAQRRLAVDVGRTACPETGDSLLHRPHTPLARPAAAADATTGRRLHHGGRAGAAGRPGTMARARRAHRFPARRRPARQRRGRAEWHGRGQPEQCRAPGLRPTAAGAGCAARVDALAGLTDHCGATARGQLTAERARRAAGADPRDVGGSHPRTGRRPPWLLHAQRHLAQHDRRQQPVAAERRRVVAPRDDGRRPRPRCDRRRAASSSPADVAQPRGGGGGGRGGGPRRARLLTWHSGGRPETRLSARTLTPPATDRSGNVYVVADDGRHASVIAVTPSGQRLRVYAPALASVQVRELSIAPDGSRVAAVVGRPGQSRLLVGRVAGGGNKLTFDGFRNVLPSWRDVSGVTWDGAEQLAVTAADEGPRRRLVVVDADGYSWRVLSTDGVRGEPVAAAAAPGQQLVLLADGVIWSARQAGGWRRVGPGRQPGYPG